MNFLNKLQAHVGELIKLTAPVKWMVNNQPLALDESMKDKVFLLMNAVGNKKGQKYPLRAITSSVGHGENRYVLLLIEGEEIWMIVSELDVEFILPGEKIA
jgi:hypothetical protein